MSALAPSRLIRCLALAGASLVALTFPQAAHAVTFTVTKEADTADGACNADCSLREAVIAANAAGDEPVVSIPPGNYTLSIGGAGDDAATGDVDLTATMTIRGTGGSPGATVIDATGLGDRIFDVLSGGREFEFTNLTLRGGSGNGGAIRNASGEITVRNVVFDSNAAPDTGGAIFNEELSGGARIAIVGSTFTNNTAAGAGGGAIRNDERGRILITRSAFSGNRALGSGRGGAIYNDDEGSITIEDSVLTGSSTNANDGGAIFTEDASVLTILRSTISTNTSAEAGGAIYANNDTLITIADSVLAGNRSNGVEASVDNSLNGGGVMYANNDSSIWIVRSTLSGNHAQHHGGAIFRSNDGVLGILNSTLSGNTTAARGGALYFLFEPRATIESSTIAGNSAALAGGGIYDRRIVGGSGTLTLGGTIIATNTAAGVASDCVEHEPALAISSAGFNLDGGTGCGLAGPGDLQNGDPLLGPLQANGGPTPTHALLAGSGAIDTGGAACPAIDQRGVARPLGAACDIGAFEAAPEPPGGVPDTIAPVLRGLSLSPRRFRAAARGPSLAQRRRSAPIGSRLAYGLSEAAQVRFQVQRRSRGRRAGGRCVKPNRRNRGRPRCNRFKRLRGAFTHAGDSGANSVEFRGRLRGKKLRPGRYRLVAIATDAAGNRSDASRKGFRIVR